MKLETYQDLKVELYENENISEVMENIILKRMDKAYKLGKKEK